MLLTVCALIALSLPTALAAIGPGFYRISNAEYGQTVVVREVEDSGYKLFIGDPDGTDVWVVRAVEDGYSLYNAELNCAAGLGPVPLVFPPVPWPVSCFSPDSGFGSTYTFDAAGGNLYKIRDPRYRGSDDGYLWQVTSESGQVYERPPSTSNEVNWVFTPVDA